MTFDEIIEIRIDAAERLYLKPAKEDFKYIWRSAAEVHWDEKGGFLYSPKPREWSYFEWYAHIESVVGDEYGCRLQLAKEVKWSNIPENLKAEIIEFDKKYGAE